MHRVVYRLTLESGVAAGGAVRATTVPRVSNISDAAARSERSAVERDRGSQRLQAFRLGGVAVRADGEPA